MIARSLVLLILALALPATATALTFRLPEDGDQLVGDNMVHTARHEDTFVALGRTFGVGFRALRAANPEVHPWVPGEGTAITLPLSFILPARSERESIVLNLAEFRLYHFLPAKNTVRTYAVGIGRQGWETPTVATRVTGTAANPSWTPPASIRREHAEQGDILPRVVPPGPDNPLGKYAVRLSAPGYLFHGTNRKLGIGMRVSHGCIRLYDGDIEELAHSVEYGTPVHIVNEPVKAGWRDGRLYLEVHPQLEEDEGQPIDFEGIVDAALARQPERDIEVDWERARETARRQSGMPVAISAD